MAGNILYIAFIMVIFREKYHAAAEVQDEDDPLSWLTQQCEENDDSARAMTAMQGFKLCIVYSEVIPLPLNFTGPKVASVELLLKICDKSEALLKCVKQLTYDVKPCFTAEDDLEIANVLANRAANFICVENTSMIKEFIANNGHICYDEKEKEKAFEKCQKEMELAEGTLLANDHHISNFGKKECALLTEYQKCMVQQLRSCPEPTADYVNSFWDAMLESLSCNRAVSFGMSLGRFVLLCATATLAVTAISFK